MTVRAIIAADPSGIIGINNTLPWRYKADMARFKALTTGGVVVMGRKTFESIPSPKEGPCLPGRDVIVITRNLDYNDTGKSRRLGSTMIAGCGAIISCRVDSAITCARDTVASGRDVWIIGGAEIYLQAVETGLVEEIDYTLVPAIAEIPEGAEITRLPKNFLSGYELVSETVNETDTQLLHRLYRRCSSPLSK